MSTALTKAGVNELLVVAEALAKSTRFKDDMDPYKAFAKIQAGAELGLGPVASLNNIHIISGKISLGSGVISTLIQQSNKYRYRVERQDNTGCEINWYEKLEDGTWENVGKSSFLEEDAKLAGLLNKDNWKKYPSDMYFARCLTRGARRFASGIFMGPIYVPEELGDYDDVEVDEEFDNLSFDEFCEKAKVEILEELDQEQIKTFLKAEGYSWTLTPKRTMFEKLQDKFGDVVDHEEVVVA